MRNVLTIFKRDVLRLLKVPAAWVIIFGLTFIPPLYAWFNILGFWDPYGNTTNIHVAIVNQDKGTDNDLTGKVNLGNEIVTELKGNHQLGWQFVSEDEAMRQVKSGQSYAAIIIPQNFSEQLTGVVTDGSARPQLHYYVNEKANAIATKVTDTGASTVDKKVNNAFVSTASKVVSSAINSTDDQINAAQQQASNEAIAGLSKTIADLKQVRSSIDDVSQKLQEVPNQTQEIRQTLLRAQTAQANASKGFNKASGMLGQTQSSLNDFIGSSSSNMDQASGLLSQSSSQAHLALSQVTGNLTVANSNIEAVIDQAQKASKSNEELITELETLKLPGSQDLITSLKRQNSELSQSISNLQKLNKDTGLAVNKSSSLADAINESTQVTIEASRGARQNIISGALPQLNKGLTTLAGTSSALGAGLGNQSTFVQQANIALDQIDQTAAASLASFKSTDAYLATLEGKLTTVSTDISALGSSNALAKHFGSDGKLDVSRVADFMLSPTVLDTKVVYPVSTYGSGMAPLFVNLSLWVGAFTLMVIVKLEVDDEGLDNPTPGERYWGRWLLLAPVAAAQGLATTVGALVIGVQTASAPLFILTAMITSLVYLSIMYALSTTFMHVGKALCIILVILQIPGASGLYPIEMMPAFFRRLYPFFPFTYSINALRETIGGFYGNDWLKDLGRLFIFAILFFLLGLVGRPRLNNLNRLFAREIAEGDMIVSEPVQQISHEFTLSQAIAVLADKEEYRQEIVARATKFARLYPKLKRGALIVGIVVPVAMALIFTLKNGTMLVALTAWIIWVLAIITFLMTIEMMRDNVVRQLRLGTLSEDTIRTMLSSYDNPRGKKTNLTRIQEPQKLRTDLAESLDMTTPLPTESSEGPNISRSTTKGDEQE